MEVAFSAPPSDVHDEDHVALLGQSNSSFVASSNLVLKAKIMMTIIVEAKMI